MQARFQGRVVLRGWEQLDGGSDPSVSLCAGVVCGACVVLG